MAAIAYMALGSQHALWRTFRAAEDDGGALMAAQDMVERLPSLHRRRLLAAHSSVTWPRKTGGAR
jgi:hypothetical protein